MAEAVGNALQREREKLKLRDKRALWKLHSHGQYSKVQYRISQIPNDAAVQTEVGTCWIL